MVVMQKAAQDIIVWQGCAPEVAKAIEAFSARMGPYSARSRLYPIWQLLREVIDPALRNYAKSLAADDPLLSVPGIGTKEGFSDIARAHGFDLLARLMRMQLRGEVITNQAGEKGAATLESLVELAVCCAGKQPAKLKAGGHETRNARNWRPFCELCGEATEFGAWLANEALPTRERKPIEFAVRPSVRYCAAHSAKAGLNNLVHKQAMRSKAWFEEEVRRLRRQVSSVSRLRAESGNPLVDMYVMRYVAHRSLYPDEVQVLRNIARQWVDSGLTDRKKELLVLHAEGLSRTAIAGRLGVSRQAVSKLFKTILPEHYLDVGPANPGG